MLLAALAAQERHDLVHDLAAVLLLAYPGAGGAAAHLAVEAGLPVPGAALEREDPAKGLHARVEHPGAPVRADVDDAVLRGALRHPDGHRVRLVGVQPYKPTRLVVAADGVVAGQEAFDLPRLQYERVQLALGLLDLYFCDLLDEPPDLPPPVPPVKVRADPRL